MQGRVGLRGGGRQQRPSACSLARVSKGAAALWVGGDIWLFAKQNKAKQAKQSLPSPHLADSPGKLPPGPREGTLGQRDP